MERLVDRFLVKRAFLGLRKNPLVNASIVSAERGAQHVVRIIKTVHDSYGVWPNFME